MCGTFRDLIVLRISGTGVIQSLSIETSERVVMEVVLVDLVHTHKKN